MKNDMYQISDSEIDDFEGLYDVVISEADYYIMTAKLKLDEVLRHKYLVYKMLRNEIEQNALSNKFLKSRFSQLDQKTDIRANNRKFIVSTVFGCLLFTGSIIFWNVRQKRDASIYDRYRDTEIGLPIKMSSKVTAPIDQAMIDMAKKKYSTAIISLNKCATTDTSMYYIAFCKEQLGADIFALKVYSKLTHSLSLIIRDKSLFRMALLHLKQKNPTAKSEFLNIAESPTNVYSSLAREIIASMKKR